MQPRGRAHTLVERKARRVAFLLRVYGLGFLGAVGVLVTAKLAIPALASHLLFHLPFPAVLAAVAAWVGLGHATLRLRARWWSLPLLAAFAIATGLLASPLVVILDAMHGRGLPFSPRWVLFSPSIAIVSLLLLAVYNLWMRRDLSWRWWRYDPAWPTHLVSLGTLATVSLAIHALYFARDGLGFSLLASAVTAVVVFSYVLRHLRRRIAAGETSAAVGVGLAVRMMVLVGTSLPGVAGLELLEWIQRRFRGGLLSFWIGIAVALGVWAAIPPSIEGAWVTSSADCLCSSRNFLYFEAGQVRAYVEGHRIRRELGTYVRTGWNSYRMERVHPHTRELLTFQLRVGWLTLDWGGPEPCLSKAFEMHGLRDPDLWGTERIREELDEEHAGSAEGARPRTR